MKPVVSIIMNTINEKPYRLERAIKSCLNQKDVEVDLIISTVEADTCIELLSGIQGIRIVTIPKSEHPGKMPRGSFLQLNNALPHIHGDWFVFASSNDYIFPDKLIKEINACIASGKEVCYSSYKATDLNDNVIQTILFHEYNYEAHLKGNFVSDLAIISRRLVDKYLPFRTELNNYAYWDLWLRIYEGEGNVFCYQPEPTWAYCMYDDSMHIVRKRNAVEQAKEIQDRNRMLALHIKQ